MSAVDDRPKQLTVRTAISEPGHVTLVVQDSGPGVDPANLERIFDAFYSTKPGGLGMGLSVCRAIVEAHGGKLWATTGAPHGAVFQLILPVTADSGSVRNLFAVPRLRDVLSSPGASTAPLADAPLVSPTRSSNGGQQLVASPSVATMRPRRLMDRVGRRHGHNAICWPGSGS